jgi:predicted enzyme related to lactoylglutathione lyase
MHRTLQLIAALALGSAAGFTGGLTAATPEKITGIGGIFFKSRDPAATTAWYHEHLGVPIHREQGSFFAWKELDRPQQTARTVWSAFPADTDYFAPGGAEFMVNYRVRDLDALLAQLRAAGVQVVGKTEEYPYGRFAWILDPEGRKIELWQPIGE